MNEKSTNIYESGIIASQHLDPETKKLTLSLNLTKDYMKIKNLLKQSLLSEGFANVEIVLAQK